MIYELQALYDNRQSFYRKAYIEELDNGGKLLISYGTQVAVIIDNKVYKLWDGYSQTTMRHVKEFIRQETGETITKQEWDNIPLQK